MVKKVKRKYTRKVSPEVVLVKSDRVKYTDLPLSLRKEIEHIIEHRKALNLFDDTVERKERALSYYMRGKGVKSEHNIFKNG